MKKSFMTRVLAMGLSFAMAFSLSAATNVAVASAAAKKVGVTTMMKVSTKSVTEGKTVKTYMNSTALKKYRIKKVAKLSATADKYIDVDVITTGKKARQGLEITAHEGAVTAAKLTKKGVYVTIYFAQTTSATKAAKATAVKYTKLKVAVNAKPVEKTTMTAAATGVKKITVTFNKAVDTTTTKLVVKKQSATPTITPTFAEDGKSAEIAMGTKLTEGTYTVEATVGEDVLTADIAVENERLDAFALVSSDLVASADSTTTASIKFKALNQYEEMMPADNLQATCSFGKVKDGTDGVKTPTADKVGTITVTDINPTLAVVGQTGTLVIVDKTTGKSLNTTVTYQSKAVASAATVAGVYSDKTEKVIDGSLKAGDKVTNDWLMLNVQDQYGSDMSVKAIADSKCEVSFNPASVLTNVSVAKDKLDKTSTVDGTNIAELSKEGKTYILVKITAGDASNGTIDKAGTLNLTIVSANKGVLASPSIKVEDKVLIASLSVSPADTLYADQDNKLVVEAVDSNGNAVTKYDDLKKAISYAVDSGIKLKKNSDGTGTFYYNPGVLWGTKANNWKDSKITTLVMYANDTTSGNYIVKTVNVTYYAKKQAWAVAGVGDKTVTAVVSGGTATFDVSTLKYEDQYGNPMAFADIKTKEGITFCVADNKDAIVEFDGITTDGSITTDISATRKKLTFEGKKKGTANVYFLYKNPKAVDAGKATVSDEVYDLKVPVTVTTSNNVVASDLTLTINDGKTIYAVNDVTLEESTTNSVRATTTGSVTASAVVTAKINGKNVVLPTSQFTIINNKISGLKKVTDTNPAKTETKTITAVVQTEDGPQTVTADVEISNADAKAAKIEKADSTTLYRITTTVTHSALFECIKVTDQYGNKMEKESETVMKITATGTNASDLKIEDGSTQKAYIKVLEHRDTKHTVTVTYEYGGLSLEVDVTLDPGAKPAS